jgi:NADPH:quinone reductase-like Zn-dependent oxidoreductase
MKAAVVTDFAKVPEYREVDDPTVTGPDQQVVDVLASALSPRVRSQASGSHYSSDGELPLIPGIDGVGRTASGELRYFLLPDTNRGAMAERVAIDVRRSIPLPQGADPVQIAAAMNPVMSSWVALRRRIAFRRGQSVMVLGAGGNAGRLAVQVAQHLGAAEVFAVERGASREQLAEQGGTVDVVLDYLWGEPTTTALQAIVPARADDSQKLTWVQIGSVAGPESPIPSAALRAINLRIVGSGQGSVDPGAIKDELRRIAREVGKGTFDLAARPVPLADVAEAFTSTSRDRLVLVP